MNKSLIIKIYRHLNLKKKIYMYIETLEIKITLFLVIFFKLKEFSSPKLVLFYFNFKSSLMLDCISKENINKEYSFEKNEIKCPL